MPFKWLLKTYFAEIIIFILFEFYIISKMMVGVGKYLTSITTVSDWIFLKENIIYQDTNLTSKLFGFYAAEIGIFLSLCLLEKKFAQCCSFHERCGIALCYWNVLPINTLKILVELKSKPELCSRDTFLG